MIEKLVKVCKCGHKMKVWEDDVVVNSNQKNKENTYTCECPVCSEKSDVVIPFQE